MSGRKGFIKLTKIYIIMTRLNVFFEMFALFIRCMYCSDLGLARKLSFLFVSQRAEERGNAGCDQ